MGSVKKLRVIAMGCVAMALLSVGGAQSMPTFTRPGSMIVTGLFGSAEAVSGGTERPLKLDERVRAEVNFRTARKSTLTVELSNGTVAKLGSDSELAVDEFWQQPHSQAGKMEEWKEEPSPSLTKMRLVRGDLTLHVKPLKAAAGSSFTIGLVAGTVRVTRGQLFLRVQMTELGIGLCTLELQDGAADFEPAGGSFSALPVRKRLLLAVEIDRGTGAVKVSDAPRADERGK